MRLDPLEILGRFLERPRIAYIRAVLDTYGGAPGGLLANGLAFTALFASIPTALVALGLAGWLVDDPALQAALARTLVAAFPPLADVIDASLAALRDGAAVTSVIGVIGLVWTVSRVFVTLETAFARVFPLAPERSAVRRTARGFIWVGLVVAAVIGAIVIGGLVAAAGALLPPGAPTDSGVAGMVASWPVLIVLAIIVVGAIYRFVPGRTPAWGAIAGPAVGAGVAIALLSQLFAFLAPRVVGLASVVGPLATVFIALAWLSFTFQVLLLGAAWVRVEDLRRREAGASALATPASSAEPGIGGE